jgi:hypothetical protein
VAHPRRAFYLGKSAMTSEDVKREILQNWDYVFGRCIEGLVKRFQIHNPVLESYLEEYVSQYLIYGTANRPGFIDTYSLPPTYDKTFNICINAVSLFVKSKYGKYAYTMALRKMPEDYTEDSLDEYMDSENLAEDFEFKVYHNLRHTLEQSEIKQSAHDVHANLYANCNITEKLVLRSMLFVEKIDIPHRVIKTIKPVLEYRLAFGYVDMGLGTMDQLLSAINYNPEYQRINEAFFQWPVVSAETIEGNPILVKGIINNTIFPNIKTRHYFGKEEHKELLELVIQKYGLKKHSEKELKSKVDSKGHKHKRYCLFVDSDRAIFIDFANDKGGFISELLGQSDLNKLVA